MPATSSPEQKKKNSFFAHLHAHPFSFWIFPLHSLTAVPSSFNHHPTHISEILAPIATTLNRHFSPMVFFFSHSFSDSLLHRLDLNCHNSENHHHCHFLALNNNDNISTDSSPRNIVQQCGSLM
ncbi:hypothetical protein Ancab_040084 [Ancistrocladus abbreviatus]